MAEKRCQIVERPIRQRLACRGIHWSVGSGVRVVGRSAGIVRPTALLPMQTKKGKRLRNERSRDPGADRREGRLRAVARAPAVRRAAGHRLSGRMGLQGRAGRRTDAGIVRQYRHSVKLAAVATRMTPCCCRASRGTWSISRWRSTGSGRCTTRASASFTRSTTICFRRASPSA